MSPKGKFSPTPEMIRAAHCYITAKAFYETILPEIQAIQKRLMHENKFPYDQSKVSGRADRLTPTGYCTEWSLIYLISDDDFEKLMCDYKQAFTEAGFSVKKEGDCPALTAEFLMTQAKWLFFEVMEPVNGFCYSDLFLFTNWKTKEREVLDLMIQLIRPYLIQKQH